MTVKSRKNQCGVAILKFTTHREIPRRKRTYHEATHFIVLNIDIGVTVLQQFFSYRCKATIASRHQCRHARNLKMKTRHRSDIAQIWVQPDFRFSVMLWWWTRINRNVIRVVVNMNWWVLMWKVWTSIGFLKFGYIWRAQTRKDLPAPARKTLPQFHW